MGMRFCVYLAQVHIYRYVCIYLAQEKCLENDKSQEEQQIPGNAKREMEEKETRLSREQRVSGTFVLNCTTEILFFVKSPVFILTKS